MYDLVVFDFDGTLCDTSEGIVNSYKHIINEKGFTDKSDEQLLTLIGGDLFKNIKKTFNLSSIETREAIDLYRNWYKSNGIYQFSPYSGIKKLITKLRNRGIRTAIATLKYESFANEMLQYSNMDNLFDYVCGMDKCDKRSKSDMINLCKNQFLNCKKSVMVGDAIGDYTGAKKSSIDFIGVSYGFGFNKFESYPELNNSAIANNIDELEELLLKTIT